MVHPRPGTVKQHRKPDRTRSRPPSPKIDGLSSCGSTELQTRLPDPCRGPIVPPLPGHPAPGRRPKACVPAQNRGAKRPEGAAQRPFPDGTPPGHPEPPGNPRQALLGETEAILRDLQPWSSLGRSATTRPRERPGQARFSIPSRSTRQTPATPAGETTLTSRRNPELPSWDQPQGNF